MHKSYFAKTSFLLFILLLSITTSSSADVAFAWANKPQSQKYTPSKMYTRNQEGSVTITRSAVGNYTVIFHNLSRDKTDGPGTGGHVQVSAYASSAWCAVQSWGSKDVHFAAGVRCYKTGANTKAGAIAADTQFTIMVHTGAESVVIQETMLMQKMELGGADIEGIQADLEEMQQDLQTVRRRINMLENR